MRLRHGLAALAALAFTLSSAAAQDVTKIRFTLDWKLQGIHSWYFQSSVKRIFVGSCAVAPASDSKNPMVNAPTRRSNGI